MPFKDRTGPEGKGPVTGRVSGYCAETDALENIISQGRGSGRGRGDGRGIGRRRRGWGWGGRFFAAPDAISPEQEVNVLESQVKSLQNALRFINDRLDKLKE
jgi:hypothetical protein